MTNILFYEPATPVGRSGVGGSLVSLLHLVQKLDTTRFRPVIVLRHDFDITDEYERAGCRVIYMAGKRAESEKKSSPIRKTLRKIPAKTFFKEVERIIKGSPSILNLIKIIKKENIDLVHCNSKIELGFPAVVASIFTATPCICHNRSYIGDISILFRMLAKNVSVHIAISSSIKNALIEKGVNPEKISLVHNWINVESHKPLRESCLNIKTGDELRILSVGRIIPWKGQHVLITESNTLKEKGLSFKVFIYGHYDNDDEYFLYLKKMVEDYELHSYISFEGYRPYKNIYSREFHLSVHTSVEPEPFGRVIIEAMYNKIPVIASGLGGVLDIVDEGVNGLLFDPFQPNSLTEKILQISSNDELRKNLTEQGMATVMNNFSGSTGIQKITSLYEKLLRRESL